MKKQTILLFSGIGVLLLGAWYFLKNKTLTTGTVQNTTGSQTGVWQWFPGFDGFTSGSLTNQKAAVSAATGLVTSISNAFGANNGGQNPGVSIGGSAAGGIASSGGGAGLPSPLSNISSVFDTSFAQSDYSLSALNNYDVLNAPSTTASTNAGNSDVWGYDNSGIAF